MILSGIAEWASLYEPNTKFDPVYTVDLLIDDAEKKRLEDSFSEFSKKAKRPTIKKDENGLWRLKIKQKFLDADGNERPPISVVDVHKNPMTELIGNGSRVNVIARVTEVNTKSFGDFVGVYLHKVQVVELVEYASEDFEDIPEPTTNNSDASTDDEEF